MYDAPFVIDAPTSNNAFSFSERQTPKIHVPALIEGTLNDVSLGQLTVFEDFENAKLKSCTGLQNFVKTSYSAAQTPVYIFDNHNHAFFFWHHERNKGVVAAPLTLIHIDQHKDTRQPPTFLSKQDSHDDQQLFHYTNTALNVGNFIPPAIKTGLISKVLNIDSEQSLNIKPPINYILDIDIDFFAPEMSYINHTKKITTIQQLLPHAQLITVATSPFFIDQKQAIQVVHEIFS